MTKELRHILKAFIPVMTTAIGVCVGEPVLFFLSGIFVSIYLSISFQELKEFFVGPSGIKVTFAQLKSALEDLILLSAKINTDLITYHNMLSGMPEQLMHNYINELENILLGVKVEDKNKLREVVYRIFVFLCRSKYHEILHKRYDAIRTYIHNKGLDLKQLNELSISSHECPQLPNKREWETFLTQKGIEIDPELEKLLEDYERALTTYIEEISKIKNRLYEKFKLEL